MKLPSLSGAFSLLFRDPYARMEPEIVAMVARISLSSMSLIAAIAAIYFAFKGKKEFAGSLGSVALVCLLSARYLPLAYVKNLNIIGVVALCVIPIIGMGYQLLENT